ncbi:DNA-methyltransferase [Chitinimonas koreensis]|uniref:DNA-methyltransferase n=1 Tax=Chitinimonas koreensis TaxID=356302 RepID=UPI00402B4378
MTKLENQCYFGDCRELLPAMAQEGLKAQMCVTSPPYFGLRDYGVNGQIGLEGTPEQYIEHLVEVFRHVRQILSDDGTLWLNIGDSYAGGGNGGGGSFAIDGIRGARLGADKNKALRKNARGAVGTCKPKDLIGIPWMLAFALRADGWYLRQDIIWSKPNPMPESVRDRCTKAHEYLFLLSKSPRYFFDSDALREPAAESSRQRWTQDIEAQAGSDRVPGKTNGPMKAAGGGSQQPQQLRPSHQGHQRPVRAEAPAPRRPSGRPLRPGTQQAQRLDGGHTVVQRRPLRDIPGGTGRAVHSRRQQGRRHGDRPIFRQRHDWAGCSATGPEIHRVRAEPQLRIAPSSAAAPAWSSAAQRSYCQCLKTRPTT